MQQTGNGNYSSCLQYAQR